MRFTRILLSVLFMALGASVYGQTLYLEMQVQGAESLSSREAGFLRAAADGLLDALWEAGYIAYDAGDSAWIGEERYLPNLLETAREGGAQLLLLVELKTDRSTGAEVLAPRSVRYRLVSVAEGVPVESGTAAAAGLIPDAEVDQKAYWTALGSLVGQEVLNAQ